MSLNFDACTVSQVYCVRKSTAQFTGELDPTSFSCALLCDELSNQKLKYKKSLLFSKQCNSDGTALLVKMRN